MRTLETGYSDGGEYTMLRKDGSKFFGERLSAVLRNPDGEPIGLVIRTRDITSRKKAVDQLASLNQELKSLNSQLETKVEERTRQLEEAVDDAKASNQAKSEFLASMSHELRTPLNAIIGFSQVLHEQYFGSLNDKQAEYVSDIVESGKHLLSLINDILDLSKVEAGKMELDVSPGLGYHHADASSTVFSCSAENWSCMCLSRAPCAFCQASRCWASTNEAATRTFGGFHRSVPVSIIDMCQTVLPHLRGMLSMPVKIRGERYYRTSEAAKIAGISRSTLLRWIGDGIFKILRERFVTDAAGLLP